MRNLSQPSPPDDLNKPYPPVSPQPAAALLNSVPTAYLFQLDAIADETQFFPAMLGPWHKLTLRRQDMRAQSEWKENFVKKRVNDRRLGLIDDFADVIDDTDDFFDLGASRIKTMSTGYTNKDCMTASLDDIFTTSACVKDYNNTASLEFDLHNDVEEMVYLGLRCVYVLVCVCTRALWTVCGSLPLALLTTATGN